MERRKEGAVETVFLEFGFNFLCLAKPSIFNLHSERYTVTPAGFTVHRASSAFFTSSVPVACPHLTPQLRRPCAGVSGSVGLASIPSSICFAAGALVCVCPSYLRTAFKLRGLAGAHSCQANASPSEVWEAKPPLNVFVHVMPTNDVLAPLNGFVVLIPVLVFDFKYTIKHLFGFALFVRVCVCLP
ncbi:hypothetical protein TIFTF001_052107 [Ficus carica]|uniref:Uncharacterized protein n=1 Tax=Ficus carica TaxID=3494 RepID=A0AA88JI48_FICCA|nr:hypothetical protein TIFTF001_052107 [Ficus carica]